MIHNHYRKLALGAVVFAALQITGCATGEGNYSSTAYQQQQHVARLAAQSFYQCKEEALVADTAASRDKRPAAYLQSAQIMDGCLAQVSSSNATVDEEELMRGHALVVQNYLKAGDVVEAARQLDQFRTLYAGNDLYFADRSSFIDTMSLLLGQHNIAAASDSSRLNVSSQIKAEYRRINHWTKN